MVAKESVRSRMDGESGISFTEFSYMLLQANDFAWLNEHEGCVLQIGGSDQWGNITAGIDLVRRRHGRAAHGLTWPLMTKADGTKFGKSAGGNVWLGAHRTSPYAFYQYWMQADDRDVERFLLQLTLLPVASVHELLAAHGGAPEQREAQRVLAAEVTTLVHGSDALAAAQEATGVVFSRGDGLPSAAALASLVDGIPTTRLDRGGLAAGVGVIDLLAATGVASSKGEARRLLDQQGVSINGARPPADAVLGPDDLWHGRFFLVRKGKRQVELVVAD
jgi:tyrosyl-tRNA synthetase